MVSGVLSVAGLGLLIMPVMPGQVLPPGNPEIAMEQSVADVSTVSFPKELIAEDYRQIRQFSSDYGIDHRLMIALIQHESQFDKEAVSERGATGMMQIMPVTNAELNEELQIENPSHPHENLRAGIYYFSRLYNLFKGAEEADRICLALAAYNAGPARVYDAQELAAYMGENPNRWSSIQTVLPLLSKRYYSLHSLVWEDQHPRSGYFGSYRQTILYVDRIMSTYRKYRSVL